MNLILNFQAPRPLKRLALILFSALVLISLSFILEPRHRAINCRSFWSCLSGPTSYQLINLDVPSEQQVNVIETTLSDGTVRFNRKLNKKPQSILFLVLTRDGNSWSRDFQSTRRSIYDFLDLLASTQLSPVDVALGMLTASESEYKILKTATNEIPLGRVTIFHRNDTGTSLDYKDRHRPEIQDERRAAMARTRNYLMHRALQDEEHVFWVDADVVEFSPGIVQTMIRHATSRKDAGIITARCEQNEMDNYDKNAWAVNKNSKLFVSPPSMDSTDQKALSDELAKSKQLVPELIRTTNDNDLIPVSSVGGTLLYLRADLIRQGIMFPWYRTVGTSWTGDGWVGLETEGLCYLSQYMDGGGCFVLGGTHKVRHTDWG